MRKRPMSSKSVAPPLVAAKAKRARSLDLAGQLQGGSGVCAALAGYLYCRAIAFA